MLLIKGVWSSNVGFNIDSGTQELNVDLAVFVECRI